MEVSHELTDELNGVITIKLQQEDYQPKVEDTLRSYRKQANMPGFRKGHVPMGMVKKMYGRSVMAEEVNRILLDQLNQYLRGENLNILGQPLPKPDDTLDFDVNKAGDLSFHYEIGLAPEFEAAISEKDKYTEYAVAIDEALLEKYTKDLQRRYGKVSQTEVAEENDMISGPFAELDEAGSPLADGIQNTSTISLEFLEDEKVRKALTGSKVGDIHTVNPDQVSKGPSDKASMLGISQEEAERNQSQFQFTVEQIYRMAPAELDQEFFDKVFGKDTVTSQEEFEARLTEELKRVFGRDSEQLLFRHIQDGLIEKFKLELPDTFLKKWLKEANEQPITEEQVNEEYDTYARQLRWQLIENNLIKKYELQVAPEEAKAHTKELVANQYRQYGIQEMEDSVLEEAADRILANEEEGRQVFENLYRAKLLQLFKETLKLKSKEVDFDEFVKLATGKPPKKGIFNNLKSLFD